MYEKRLREVLPQPFTADGTTDGKITLSDTIGFKVKQHVVLSNSGGTLLRLEVKRVESSTTLYVGPISSKITDRSDISAFTLALASTIYAQEQPRPNVPEQEIERLTYEEEPTVARRVILVDPYGEPHDESNPVPVEATISIGTVGTPIIYNVSALVAGTEYSQALPNNTAQFVLRARNNAKLQLSYAPGNSSTLFLTLLPGNIYQVEGVKLTSKTIYFTSNKDNTIVEILAWT